MKNFLKKLHIVPTHPPDDLDNEPQKPISSISNWLNAVTSKQGSSTPSPPPAGEVESSVGSSSSTGMERIRRESGSGRAPPPGHPPPGQPPPPPPPALTAVEAETTATAPVAEEEDLEDYQLQLALELSAREDPEAVQIEVAKQISLGSCPVESTPAEVTAYRYWTYNALSYDDKILDGFYDFYGIFDSPNSPKLPSLIDLQDKPSSENYAWEAVLVNRAEDSDLVKLEQKASIMASESRSDDSDFVGGVLVQRLASLVADYMGGKFNEPEKILVAYQHLSKYLRAIVGNMVLPLGRITIGLARHRALLFKVLADSLGIPCRLVKGKQYTGSEDGALNIVKFDDGREFIVDLMADPGTLVPSDGAVLSIEYEQESLFPANHFNLRTNDNKPSTSSTSGPHSGNQAGHSKITITPSEPAVKLETKPVSSPAVRRNKVKDVSQYMINAAKENPGLAQKLHDVLLESGVEAPADLFSELSSSIQLDEPEPSTSAATVGVRRRRNSGLHGPFLPQLGPVKSAEGGGAGTALSAAVATAAVVASSMVVAAAKSNSEMPFEKAVPAPAVVATVTAAAVVATTAAVTANNNPFPNLPLLPRADEVPLQGLSRGDDHEEEEDEKNVGEAANERISDKSTGTESIKSDVTLDDVAELEIQWEDITLGERIGLGSFGEVYKGDWHGTEIAVKKFLHQDISSDALEEFRSEVRIMKRLRHPNVVLLMGAVTKVPNLSIITEFLPRGSLFRLIHRPNNQLDEKRRLRMALDVARGMNYLHNCTPMVVHRDLKSPNLLVDKNWVVKVCDFGLSRMKQNTFLSSRSTAGTAEWMAPEVLRNEPSDEKCDVFSFGVILWELMTLQQPWEGMNPMQVVGAVGFQHRRLEIPAHLDPVISQIILQCWQTDSKLRPSFGEIMAALKPLLKAMPAQQGPRQRVLQGSS
ncbi:hypothetical protein LUZ60_000294 [Juncus effusus]|nr:hypothetical protein LUZ60_000294 [Juncus effusus]